MDLKYSHKKQKPFNRRAFCRPGTPQSNAQCYTFLTTNSKRYFNYAIYHFDNRIEIGSPGDLPQGISLKDLHQPHQSVLRNGTIGELLYLVRYIEKGGTGIQNIKDWMNEHGLEEPILKLSGQNYVLTLKRPLKTGGQISGQINYERLTTRQIEIINYIIENNHITRNELTKKVGINPSAIQRQIENLKEKGLLERVGTKGGYWKVKSEEGKS